MDEGIPENGGFSRRGEVGCISLCVCVCAWIEKQVPLLQGSLSLSLSIVTHALDGDLVGNLCSVGRKNREEIGKGGIR